MVAHVICTVLLTLQIEAAISTALTQAAQRGVAGNEVG